MGCGAGGGGRGPDRSAFPGVARVGGVLRSRLPILPPQVGVGARIESGHDSGAMGKAKRTCRRVCCILHVPAKWAVLSIEQDSCQGCLGEALGEAGT